MSQRILVSGGLGFLGAHLCRRLAATDPDCALTIVDNLSSTRLDTCVLPPSAAVVVEDFRRFEPADSWDLVFHLAGPVGSVGILPRNGYVARDILELAVRAADIARASGALLLHISSSEVYGQGGRLGEDREMVVPARTGTRMEYALGKLTAEHVLLNLAQDTGMRLKICRPFNVIGEGQSAEGGFVVPTFFEHALANEPIPVYYDGAQQRSFCHVDDAIDGILAVLEKGEASTCYNVGHDGNVITIHRLAKRIKEICGSRSPLRCVDPQKLHGAGYVEGFDKVPDLTKVTRDTGWSPRIDLTEALERIHRYYTADRVAC